MRFMQNMLVGLGASLALGGTAQAATLIDISPVTGTQYNGFFQNNFVSSWSDTEGALAIGGNATLNGYGIGSHLSTADRATNNLVVGGTLNANMAELKTGSVVAGAINGQISTPNGTVSTGSVIDFAATFADLRDRSTELGQMQATGTVQNQYGNLQFNGTNAGLNVFNISGNDLQNLWGMQFNVAQGSQVLVNVDASTLSLSSLNMQLGGLSSQNILFNFTNTTQLDMRSLGFFGSILAPLADISFEWGQINGAMIGKSYTGSGELHHVGYAGGLLDVREKTPAPTPTDPTGAVPEPATWAMLILGFGLIGSTLRSRRQKLAQQIN